MVTRRVFLGAAGAVVLLASCDSSDEKPEAGGDDEAEEAAPKTFVLVHGAWHGGWCWRRVADPLRALGHRVFTPTQTGLGERSHLLSDQLTLRVFVDDVVNVIEWEDLSDVILVGHSFGGISVTGVVDRVPERISHLVYLDSFVLQDGQSAFSALPPEVAAARRKAADESSGGLSLPIPDPSTLGIVDAEDIAWVKEKCTPHPRSTYEDRLRLQKPVGNGVPVTYIAVKPGFAPTTSSRAFAKEQKDWQYLEIAAGHDAMVTSPKTLVDLLRGL